MTNKPNNPFQEYSNCCGSLMDNDQTMCPECLEPCEKETRDERGMTWQQKFDAANDALDQAISILKD